MSKFTDLLPSSLKRAPAIVAILALTAAITIPSIVSAVGASSEQVIHTIGAPCAVFDTRFSDFDGDGQNWAEGDTDADAKPVPGDELKFYIADNSSEADTGSSANRSHTFWDQPETSPTVEAHQGASQNGTDARANPDGCGVPEAAETVFININAVMPDGSGNLRAYPPATPDADKGGVIIYDGNDTLGIANGLLLEIDTNYGDGTGELAGHLLVEVNPSGSGTHVRGVITGYTCLTGAC